MTANEIATVATDAMPYVIAAAGTYGGAVLSKTRDKTTNGMVDAGARLLERVFGRREPDELPEPLADVVADPDDEDLSTALKVKIRKTLEHDPAMLEDVRAIVAEAPRVSVTQHIHAGRDAYTSARDMTIHQRPE